MITEEQYNKKLEIVYQMLQKPEGSLSPEEEKELDIIVREIEEYETRICPVVQPEK